MSRIKIINAFKQSVTTYFQYLFLYINDTRKHLITNKQTSPTDELQGLLNSSLSPISEYGFFYK